MTERPLFTRLALTLCALGAALHLYTALFRASDTAADGGGVPLFLIGLVLWSCLPYALCAAAALRRWPVSAFGAACCCLAADLFMHYSVFIAPKGSTAALGLLFTPLWNLLLIGPLGAVLGGLAGRLLARKAPPPP